MAGALLFAAYALPSQADFDPSPRPYLILLGLGFLIGTIGHVVRSKILIAAGLLTIYTAILFLPLVAYLA